MKVTQKSVKTDFYTIFFKKNCIAEIGQYVFADATWIGALHLGEMPRYVSANTYQQPRVHYLLADTNRINRYLYLYLGVEIPSPKCDFANYSSMAIFQ